MIITPEVHVYEVGDAEWWAGSSPEEVLAAAMKTYGLSHEEMTGDAAEMPALVCEAEMDRLQYFEEFGVSEPRSFREQLAIVIADGESTPCLFAIRDGY